MCESRWKKREWGYEFEIFLSTYLFTWGRGEGIERNREREIKENREKEGERRIKGWERESKKRSKKERKKKKKSKKKN